MSLHTLKDFDPNYKDHFDHKDIQSFELYTGNEKIGSVEDMLVDDNGNFRYLVISTGLWILGKKVLLPIGRARINFNAHRVDVDGLSRAQVEALPEYNGTMPVDPDHEEQVRNVYRPTAAASGAAPAATPAAFDRNAYNYKQEPALYDLNDKDHQNFKLYEERLIANKTRQKTGEVTVGKRVETETAKVSVPIEKERVVIERVTPADAGKAVAPGTADFSEGKAMRIELYEETADIRKEAFLREEVKINKVVDQETVQLQDTVRREEIDIDTEGRTTEDKTGRLPKDRI